LTRKEQADLLAAEAATAALAAVASPAVAAASRPVTDRAARYWPVLFVVPALLLAGLVGTAVVVTMTLTSEAQGRAGTAPRLGTCSAPGVPVDGLDETQMANVGIIAAVATEVGVPTRGVVVAIATALQESRLRNLASRAVPASVGQPNEGVVPGDHDSVGVFQQRPAWWDGDVAKGMSARYQARQFFGGADDTPAIPGLLDIPGWEQMPVTVAAQKVQRSAFPLAYAQWEGTAVAAASAVLGQGVECQPVASGSGDWVMPTEGRRTGDFGQCGGPWVRCHTGQDYANVPGTLVLATSAGRVVHVGPLGTYGLMVKIDHGGGVTTISAHLLSTSVALGQVVATGQVIGAMGWSGNVVPRGPAGTHLHYEVRVNDSPVDPVAWLDERIPTA
jgi:hypothetical protein